MFCSKGILGINQFSHVNVQYKRIWTVHLKHFFFQYFEALHHSVSMRLQPKLKLSAVIAIYNKRLTATTTLNQRKVWSANASVSCEAPFVCQDMFRSMLIAACRLCLIFQQYITGLKDESRHVRVVEEIKRLLKMIFEPFISMETKEIK